VRHIPYWIASIEAAHVDARYKERGAYDRYLEDGLPMDITRNQYFFAGLACLLMGLQFHLVESAELTPEFTQFLAERTGHPLASVSAATQSLTQSDKPLVKKTVRPPDWLGWSLISLGSVLILHSLGMKKPG
jgi:hypothetical protein